MRATQDGVERIHGFHRLGDYPPYVIAGLAAYPEHGKTPDDLIRCADQALYKVKHEGRNRGSIYSD